MKVWRIEYDDSYSDLFEWFCTQREANKRWEEIVRESKAGEKIRTMKRPQGELWTLHQAPHIVELPTRKEDMVTMLNADFNNADGI